MKLVTNELAPEEVEHVTENGQEFLTAPVVMARAMQLNGGYLPQSELEASKDAWDGIPVPVSHPEHNGRPISVDSPKADTPVIGEVRNPEVNGDKLTGTLYISLNDAKQATAGAQRILNNLLTGEPVEVSTAYAVGETISGNIDGQYREKAVKNIDPDHLAVLPDEKGKCAVADGCGAPVANQLYIPSTDDGVTPEDAGTTPMHANQVTYEVTDVTPEDVSGYTDREWNGSEVVSELPNPSESENAASILDETHMLVPQGDEARDSKSNWKLPFRAGADEPVNTRALVAIDAALSGARGGVEGVDSDTKEAALELTQAFLVDAPGDLFGSLDAEETEQNNRLNTVVNWVASIMSSGETAGAESPTEVETPMTNDTDKHDYLVENHGYDRANLPPEGSECLTMMVENHKELENMEQNDSDDPETVEINKDELEELVDKRVAARLEANEQSELIDEILANSDDYERDVLEDTPQSVLEDIHNDVTSEPAANMPANVGRKSVSNDDEGYSGPTDFGEYQEAE